jgi:hypothetical protein
MKITLTFFAVASMGLFALTIKQRVEITTLQNDLGASRAQVEALRSAGRFGGTAGLEKLPDNDLHRPTRW